MTTRDGAQTLTPAELAAWERMARDGSLSRYVGRKQEGNGEHKAWLQREYRAKLAGRATT